MMSQARWRVVSIVPASAVPGSGGSNVRGVRATSRMRSTLNVRSPFRVSSQPIRYSAWVWSDGSMRYGWTTARRGAASGAYGAGS